MKKIRATFTVCALMALALCATPTNAFANEVSDLALGEEVAFVEERTVPGKAQVASVEENLELGEERHIETTSQDVQLSAEDERGHEDVAAEDGGAEAGGQNNVQNVSRSDVQNNTDKTVVSYMLEGKVRNHVVGEELDLSGLYWLVTYDDGSNATVDVNPDRLDGYDPWQAGLQNVHCEQHIGWQTWIGHFWVWIDPIVDERVGNYGNVAGGVDFKPSTDSTTVQKIMRDFMARLDLGGGVASGERLEQRNFTRKRTNIKSQKSSQPVVGIGIRWKLDDLTTQLLLSGRVKAPNPTRWTIIL